MKHLITLQDCSSEWIQSVLDLSARVKSEPEAFSSAMERKTLFMLFEKPSLRTRVSFETGMTQMAAARSQSCQQPGEKRTDKNCAQPTTGLRSLARYYKACQT